LRNVCLSLGWIHSRATGTKNVATCHGVAKLRMTGPQVACLRVGYTFSPFNELCGLATDLPDS